MAHTKTGGCLCGKCRFLFVTDSLAVGACHCDICRKWCGGPAFALHHGGKMTFEDDTHVKTYTSSEWAKRGFCGECGSNLFWSMQDDSLVLPILGSLDDITDVTFTEQIFIEKKPDWYTFANDTKQKTGAEVFAEFSG